MRRTPTWGVQEDSAPSFKTRSTEHNRYCSETTPAVLGGRSDESVEGEPRWRCVGQQVGRVPPDVAPVLARAVPAHPGERTARLRGKRTILETVPAALRERPQPYRPRNPTPRRSPRLWPLALGGVAVAALAIAFATGAFSSRPTDRTVSPAESGRGRTSVATDRIVRRRTDPDRARQRDQGRARVRGEGPERTHDGAPVARRELRLDPVGPLSALEGRLKIGLNNGFFKYGDLELYCPDTPANRKALDDFKPGDELLFEAKAVTPPKGKSSSSYRQLDAEWIAPIGAPDKKVEFKSKP